jgi:hypothetical protein
MEIVSEPTTCQHDYYTRKLKVVQKRDEKLKLKIGKITKSGYL